MKLRTAIAIAVLVPLVSIGVAVLPRAVDERWAEMAAWSSKAEQEWRARDFHRPPAWGDAKPGSAFAAYADALQQAAVLGRGDAKLLADLRLHPASVTAQQAEDFSLRWRSALAAMGEGAHRDDARPLVEWQKGFGNRPTNLLNGRDLVNAAVIEVRRRLAGGRGRGAVELLLDAATFAVDLQRSPMVVDQVIASALLQITVGEALRDVDLRGLDAAALAALDQGLAAVDARSVVTFDSAGEVLLLAQTLIGQLVPSPPAAGATLLDSTEVPRSWRHGWSRRWAAADAVMKLVTMCDQIVQIDGLRWPEREARLLGVQSGLAAEPNAMVATFAPNWSGVEHTLRLAATHVRLLRLAVAFHAGRELPTLSDPLGGGAIEIVRRDRGAVFRSAGGSSASPIEREVTRR